MSNPVGRPQMYAPEEIGLIATDLHNYILENDDPTIVGFTSSYNKFNVNKDYIHDHEEFSDLTKRAVEKQEQYLLKNGGSNKYNPTIAIFRLKQPQHGYTDRSQVDNTVYLPKPILGALAKDVSTDNSDQEALEA